MGGLPVQHAGPVHVYAVEIAKSAIAEQRRLRWVRDLEVASTQSLWSGQAKASHLERRQSL